MLWQLGTILHLIKFYKCKKHGMTLILLSLPRDSVWTCSSVPAQGAVQRAESPGTGSQSLSPPLIFFQEKKKALAGLAGSEDITSTWLLQAFAASSPGLWLHTLPGGAGYRVSGL